MKGGDYSPPFILTYIIKPNSIHFNRRVPIIQNTNQMYLYMIGSFQDNLGYVVYSLSPKLYFIIEDIRWLFLPR